MVKKFKLHESLSVLIPAYNEGDHLAKVINDSVKEVKKISDDYEIVVVNDGSKDNTGNILDQQAKKNKHIRAIHHKTNQGPGKALQTGVKACKKAVIIYIEGDGQSPLKDQSTLLEKIKDADLVLGYRSARTNYTVFRKILSYGYLGLVFILFGLHYKDVNWSQAYRRKIFKKIKVKSPTPFFTTEVVIKSKRAGLRVKEAPTIYHPRLGGKTSLGNIKTAFKMFKEMLKLRFGLL